MFEFPFHLRVGQSIRRFGLNIERISDTHVSLGKGYNDLWSIAGFTDAIRADQWYGGYLLPSFANWDYDEFSNQRILFA